MNRMEPLGGAMRCNPEEPSSGAWYVLQTKRHRERLAQCHLQEHGVVSYLPQIVQWPRPAVGSAVAPMFPGYIFVRANLEQAFTRIRWTPGVRSFVTVGGVPAVVDGNIIEFLQGREGHDGLIRCSLRIREGSEVRIVRGPFRGLTAVVDRLLPARDRVQVLMDLLQRSTRVELPERWVSGL